MYFEIDDVKRRHSPYYDIYNVRGWVDPPENRFLWHWARGAMAGTIGCLVNEGFAHRWEAYKTLRTKYHPPRTVGQLVEYFKGIKTVGDFERVS